MTRPDDLERMSARASDRERAAPRSATGRFKPRRARMGVAALANGYRYMMTMSWHCIDSLKLIKFLFMIVT